MKNTNHFLIRRFENADAHQVSELIRKTLMGTNINDYPLSILQPLHDYFTPSKVKLLSTERVCLVVVWQDKIVATGAFEGNELKTVFVDPDYQGRGIGRQLVLKLEKDAKEKQVVIMNVPASISGIPFYEKLGYTKGETFLSQHAGQQTWMKKQL